MNDFITAQNKATERGFLALGEINRIQAQVKDDLRAARRQLNLAYRDYKRTATDAFLDYVKFNAVDGITIYEPAADRYWTALFVHRSKKEATITVRDPENANVVESFPLDYFIGDAPVYEVTDPNCPKPEAMTKKEWIASLSA